MINYQYMSTSKRRGFQFQSLHINIEFWDIKLAIYFPIFTKKKKDIHMLINCVTVHFVPNQTIGEPALTNKI